MVKKLTALLPMLIILGFVSAAPANATSWLSHEFHKAKHSISHAAKSVAHGVKHDATVVSKDAKGVSKVFGRAAKETANKACKKLLPGVLNYTIGKACKAAAYEVSGTCIAAISPETFGMGAIACDAAGIELYAECKHGGKMTTNMVTPITNKACNKM
jgi:hypothetical protein